MYFLMIRPQRKQQQEHQALLTALKKGDEVVIWGGMFGKIWAVEDQTVVIEIADKTRVKMMKSAVSGRAPKRPPHTSAALPDPSSASKRADKVEKRDASEADDREETTDAENESTPASEAAGKGKKNKRKKR